MSNYDDEVNENIDKLSKNTEIKDLSLNWVNKSIEARYSYNFKWMGRPIIQLPQDIIAMQELIWEIKPDLIVETGIAHGGSIIFHASMLELIGNNGEVVGVDIDIREHNKKEIEAHSMYKRISLIQGSSIAEDIFSQVLEHTKGKSKIMVVLDSNHTGTHVLKELEMYSKLVTKDSYLIILDTIIEDMDQSLLGDRPWKKGDNPKTAIYEFLKTNDRFEIDTRIDDKILLSHGPSGYLKCIKE